MTLQWCLRHGDGDLRQAAAKALKLEAKHAELLRQLESKEASKRARAVQELAGITLDLTISAQEAKFRFPPPELVQALGDEDREVREAAKTAYWSYRWGFLTPEWKVKALSASETPEGTLQWFIQGNEREEIGKAAEKVFKRLSGGVKE